MFEKVVRGGAAAAAAEIGTRGPRREFWARALASWFDAAVACESAFVAPGLPYDWRRDDRDFRAFCRACDEDADARVVETVRLRALGGDTRALSLAFRTARGLARPVDVTPVPCEEESYPPHVAEAMIAAGLAAMGAFPP
jgi:hypothetical protein